MKLFANEFQNHNGENKIYVPEENHDFLIRRNRPDLR